MSLSFYLAALAFGAVLLAATLIHGDGSVGADHGGDSGHAASDSGLSLVLGLRFWVFALTFFGLTGALLTGLADPDGAVGASAVTVPLVSAGVGLLCGGVAARLVRGLTRRPLGAVAGAEAHVGREGRVLLPISRGQRGKVRLRIGGTDTDVLAELGADAQADLPIGARIWVLEMRGATAIVDSPPGDLPSNTESKT